MRSDVVAVWRYWAGWYAGRDSLAARGVCSQHGVACTDKVVASVQLQDAGSEDVRWAVCRRGLAELGEEVPQDFPPGNKSSTGERS